MRGLQHAGWLVVVALIAFLVAGASVAVADEPPPPPLDTTPPVVSVPANINVAAPDPSGTTVSFSASATDDVDGSVAVDCNPDSGAKFSVGTTTVTCSAHDAAGNPAQASFSVTVTFTDTTAPTLHLPGTQDANATGPGGAAVSYTVTATDNVDPSPTVQCSPASGSTFPIGDTTVNCTARDNANNSAPGSFLVRVRDRTDPVLSLPASFGVNTTDPSGATVTYSPSASDAVSGSVGVSCSPASGTKFAVGQATVSCSATDGAGNTAHGSFQVTVTLVDTTPPVLHLPGNISDNTPDPAGKVETYSASATDNLDGTISAGCAPASGSTFHVGSTTVNCTATDAHNNKTSGSFSVTITLVDTTAPVLHLPGNISTTTPDPAGKAVTYSATATDNIDGGIAAACTPTSGSTFPVGTTTVSCTATDAHNNKASGSFTVAVTLVDTTPPVLANVPADISREADGPNGSVVTYTKPTASDNIDGLIPGVTCAPAAGSAFPLGTNTVTCSATDAHGNTGTASFKVIIRDTQPPVLVVPQPLTLVADASGTLPASSPRIQAWKASAQAADKVDPHPTVSAFIPETLPLGVTGITFRATDHSGNSSEPRNVTIELLAPGKPQPPAPPPTRLPKDVTGLTATAGNKRVTVKWAAPSGVTVARYEVRRSDHTHAETLVYSGKSTSFVDKGVQNGNEYRYLVVVFDTVGNRSVGASALATPKAPLLQNIKDGARVKLPKLFKWSRASNASFYNAQVFCNNVKRWTAWPVKPSLTIKRRVTFAGKKSTIAGTCTIYVWPGIGPRGDSKYGPMLGEAHFVAR